MLQIMIKTLIACVILLSSTMLAAQDTTFLRPDYKQIEKNVQKKNSPFYWPDLFKRFNSGDTSLTLQELHHFYFGFTFQDDYSPYSGSGDTEKARELYGKEADEKNLKELLKVTKESLSRNPFDMEMINLQLYSYDKLGDKENFDRVLYQLRWIYDVILSSGDGTSKENCFYVIFVSHEYKVINYLEFEFGGSQSLIEHYDYLELEKNEYDIEGFYFDITPSLLYLNRMMSK